MLKLENDLIDDENLMHDGPTIPSNCFGLFPQFELSILFTKNSSQIIKTIGFFFVRFVIMQFSYNMNNIIYSF